MKIFVWPFILLLTNISFAAELTYICTSSVTSRFFSYSEHNSPFLEIRQGMEKALYDSFANNPYCKVRNYKYHISNKFGLITEVEAAMDHDTPRTCYWQFVVRCQKLQIEDKEPEYRCQIIGNS